MKKKQFMSKLAALTMAAAMGVTALPATVMAADVKGITTNDDTTGITAAQTGYVQTTLPSISDLNLGDNQTYYVAFLNGYRTYDDAAETQIKALDKDAHASEVKKALETVSADITVEDVTVTPATGDTKDTAGKAVAKIKMPVTYDDSVTPPLKGSVELTLNLTWGTQAADALKDAVAKTKAAIEGSDTTTYRQFAAYRNENRVVNTITKALDISSLSNPMGVDLDDAYSSDYTVSYSDLKAANYVAPTTSAAGGYDLTLKVKVTKDDVDGKSASADQTITCHVTFAKKTAKRVAKVETYTGSTTTVWTPGNIKESGKKYPIDIQVTYDGGSVANTKSDLADANITLSLSDDSVAHLVDDDAANTGKALVFDKVGKVTIKYTAPNFVDPDQLSSSAVISKTGDLGEVELKDADTAFKGVLGDLDKTVTASEVSKEEDVEAVVKNKVQAAYDAYYGKATKLTITVKDVKNFKAAAAGTAENPDGTNGSFYVTVKAENVAPNVKLTATSYDAWTITADKYTKKFTDVSDTSFCAKAVAWAVDNGITTGTTATTFSPNAPVTRAQFVTFLYRQAGSPDVAVNTKFTDIADQPEVFQKAISWAAANGITMGTTDPTKFAPGTTVTRAQAVTFLFRYAKGEATTKTNSFPDVSEDAFCADAVNWGVENGVIKGYDDGRFGTNDPTTRGQAITFIYRALAD